MQKEKSKEEEFNINSYNNKTNKITNNDLFNTKVVSRNDDKNNENLVIKGNQKVLSARLADALYFYQQDLKKPFDSTADGLSRDPQKVEKVKEKINSL